MSNINAKNINTMQDITVDFIKHYMRIDHDLDDEELRLYLLSAISYVTKYVRGEYLDDVDLIMPVLMLVSHFYENKTPINNNNGNYDHIYKDVLWMDRGLVL